MTIHAPSDRPQLGLDPSTGLSIFFERDSELSLGLLRGDKERFRDLLVPEAELGEICAISGWSFDAVLQPFSVVALDEHAQAVATAEATPIRLVPDARPALNLSYAVAPAWEGQGLASTCAAYALMGAEMSLPAFQDDPAVLVQVRSGNPASAAIARRFGLCEDRSAGYLARLHGEEVPFQVYAGPLQRCFREAVAYLTKRDRAGEVPRQR